MHSFNQYLLSTYPGPEGAGMEQNQAKPDSPGASSPVWGDSED